jgi:REP element-mobilizing transposase RayT
MPYVKVMIHAVWGTKNRVHYLTPDLRSQVIQHIKENARIKKIYIDEINGYSEHLHCLFGLNADMSIAKAMQLIKGESAYWINKNGIIKSKFEWADEYFAASVSESVLDKVRTYIKNQEEHHKVITFTQEYNQFITKYKFQVHG